jgi:hypothetical protein
MMRTSTLKQGKGFKPRTTPMSRGSGFKTPSAGASLKQTALAPYVTANHAREPKLPKLSKPMKSRGMKGRPPTAEEARFMDKMGQLPCIACLKDGWENREISLHHIDGRAKPGAHFLVLPLCAPHHQQDDTDIRQRISVHGHKKPFVARYGTKWELLAECVAMINEQGVEACEM